MADTTLIRALVGLPGLAPSAVGEFPTEEAEAYIAAGYAENANKLSSRVKAAPKDEPKPAAKEAPKSKDD